MADVTVEQIAEQNQKLAEQNRALVARLEALEAAAAAAQPAEPVPAPRFQPFPRLVYRQNLDSVSIDVPGNDVLQVNDQGAHDAAIADGWQDEPVPMKTVALGRKNGKR
jgi:hypothetical protein